MLLALICFASVTAFASKAENEQNNPACLEQGGMKGVLYYFPPDKEVLKMHEWLKFRIGRLDTHETDTRHNIPDTDKNEEEGQSEVRIRIWANPESKNQEANCKTSNHGLELFGKMKENSTFVLSTGDYKDGVCLQVEVEDEHNRWAKVTGTRCEELEVGRSFYYWDNFLSHQIGSSRKGMGIFGN